MQGHDKKENVVVLVMSYRNTLSEYEKISLDQCFSILGNYPIRIVKPVSSDISSWGIENRKFDIETFDDKYFADIGAYSRMLLSVAFYKRFIKYEYILIYQLDAFVFSDELNSWCSKGYDYVGAPWFEGFSNTNDQAGFINGGNGGFSLRKVSSHLKVLHSFSYINKPRQNWKQRMDEKPGLENFVNQAAGFLLDMTTRNNTFWMLNSFKGFEDQFWCLVAARNFQWFKIPDFKQEMEFAYEMQPKRIHELNGGRLPFGCHAWWKYDFEFWKPFILSYGYTFTKEEN